MTLGDFFCLSLSNLVSEKSLLKPGVTDLVGLAPEQMPKIGFLSLLPSTGNKEVFHHTEVSPWTLEPNSVLHEYSSRLLTELSAQPPGLGLYDLTTK